MLRIPAATYRLQFNAQFTFQQAQAIVAYLAALGISDLYASPIFRARTGSTHGYDVVDPGTINPELGGSEGFEQLSQQVQQYQLGWLQDIVPNHMAFDGQNRMLVDVLENGPDSKYQDYFDINWEHRYEGIRGRVLAPFLGKFYGDCLERGELKLHYSERGLTMQYYSLEFPIRIESYFQILNHELERLRKQLSRRDPDFVKLLGVLYALKSMPSGEPSEERYSQITFVKSMLWELWSTNAKIQTYIAENIETFNGTPGNPESYNLLDHLLTEQFYRLSFWKVGNEELNYRRFFTVNELISLRVEDPQVFESTHALIFRLVEEQKFTGLRIDHIDGLYNPLQYLLRLRERAPAAYLTVEKILEAQENLPLHWPVQGTTGYDFLNALNGLLCHADNKPALEQIYARFTGNQLDCQELIDEKKRLIIGKHLAGDIDNLAHLLKQISQRYRYASDFTIYALKNALVEVLAVFPVYRTYVSEEGLSRSGREIIRQVIAQAKENIPASFNELTFIERFLLIDFDENLTAAESKQWLHFVMRLQQFTGPLMAKGVEDTVLYIYNRLISLNEVGCKPGQFGISLDDFHAFNKARAEQFPHTMSATATHDTKRGEDTRARINVLSELPEEWEAHLQQWRTCNALHKESLQGRTIPEPNDEYFFYQTLLGVFPFDETDLPQLVERLQEYGIKAIREAKVHTAWLRPDTDYEQAYLRFVARVLAPDPTQPFWETFRPFQQKIQHYGVCNSLSQTLLKLTSPGVPDLYQGTELWDLSLVDPDNRRAVDFVHREKALQQIKARADLLPLSADLLAHPQTGYVKLFLIYRALAARREYLDLFQHGTYQKLQVVGSLRDHLTVFARQREDQTAIVIAPRLLTPLVKVGDYPLGEQVWHETRIILPPSTATTWREAITNHTFPADPILWVGQVLRHFPVALLLSE
ncbi:malto-oligosyltrehalose synthase [Anthocerotibacter panamensis]|uniref:malto-oligosyltrehalose synthase n=1 Tax=Anthocerotibacter panamensis TaxID=2857077 RepID=UPI001C407234|nr:malto-oligosyltrehalose synthase [Anthocerotibacter panamensis]